MADSGDARALTVIAGLEQLGVFSYTAASENAELSAAERAQAGRFASHAKDHVAALATELEALGADVPAPVETVEEADKIVQGIASATTRADVLEHLHDAEIAVLGACHDAAGKLLDAKLLQNAAAIMANHGQHLVVLRGWLERDPLPEPYESGRG